MTTLPKEFYRTIQEVARKAKHTSSVKQVFQDLIQVMFNTIHATQRSFPYKFHFDPRMVRELKEYKTQPELWKKLAELSKMWLKAIQAAEPFEDVMGSAYDQQLGEQLGQFLTPPDIARLLAEVNLACSKDQIDSNLEKGEPVFVGDDCGCGAGSTLLAWLVGFHSSYGPHKLMSVAVDGQDLDQAMCQLTAVQLFWSAAIHGLPLGGIAVRLGNALTEPDAPAVFTAVFSPEKVHEAIERQKTYQALRQQAQAFDKLTRKVAEPA